MIHRPCPVCQCSRVSFLAEAPAAIICGHTSGRTFTYLRCDECRSVHIAEVPNAEELSAYYSDPAYHNHMGPGQLSRADWFFNRVSRPAPRSGRRHLDYGCGPGQYMEFMRRSGWETTGAEYSEASAAAARSRYPVVLIPELDELKDGAYDYITMLHSLEHVEDPVDTLRRLARKLAPSGSMLIEVPYLECLEFRVFGAETFSMFQAPVHLQFFSDRGIAGAAMRAGLEITRIRNNAWSPTHVTWSLLNALCPSLSREQKRRIYLLAFPFVLPLSLGAPLAGVSLPIRQYRLRRTDS
jgi:2-polyprenyl-3-methyl-5-hydroxy-6-metoxy-1,4-benzoquinol methylase